MVICPYCSRRFQYETTIQKREKKLLIILELIYENRSFNMGVLYSNLRRKGWTIRRHTFRKYLNLLEERGTIKIIPDDEKPRFTTIHVKEQAAASLLRIWRS